MWRRWVTISCRLYVPPKDRVAIKTHSLQGNCCLQCSFQVLSIFINIQWSKGQKHYFPYSTLFSLCDSCDLITCAATFLVFISTWEWSHFPLGKALQIVCSQCMVIIFHPTGIFTMKYGYSIGDGKKTTVDTILLFLYAGVLQCDPFNRSLKNIGNLFLQFLWGWTVQTVIYFNIEWFAANCWHCDPMIIFNIHHLNQVTAHRTEWKWLTKTSIL